MVKPHPIDWSIGVAERYRDTTHPQGANLWADTWLYYSYALAEGICPLCKRDLATVSDVSEAVTLAAGTCPCCGMLWWFHEATPDDMGPYLEDTDDRRVITNVRTRIGEPYCRHGLGDDGPANVRWFLQLSGR
jgi:hypothetical protein